MSVVIGDHERGEYETTFVLVFDNIEDGGILYMNNEEVAVSVIIEPSTGPLRKLIEVPHGCMSAVLKINGEETSNIRFDHRSRLSNIFMVSCDHVEADTRHSLWGDVSREVDSCSSSYGRTLVLHLGDNVYADHAFNDGLEGKNALESYRERYRKTWFGSSKRKEIYSKSSHLMILDDHEVKNDFLLSELTEEEKPIADVALECYHEYQESLLLEFKQSIGKGWYRVYEDDIVITLERSDGIPSLDNIKEFINSIIAEHNPKGLIIGTAWAPLPPPEGNLKARIYGCVFGHHKFMSKESLLEFYTYILEIIANGVQVIVVGGDIHFGVHASVSKNGISFDIAAASAISNHPTLDRSLAAAGFERPIDMGNEIILRPIISEGNRCYGKLYIDHNGPKRYNFSMRYSNRWIPKSMISYLNSMARMKPK